MRSQINHMLNKMIPDLSGNSSQLGIGTHRIGLIVMLVYLGED